MRVARLLGSPTAFASGLVLSLLLIAVGMIFGWYGTAFLAVDGLILGLTGVGLLIVLVEWRISRQRLRGHIEQLSHKLRWFESSLRYDRRRP